MWACRFCNKPNSSTSLICLYCQRRRHGIEQRDTEHTLVVLAEQGPLSNLKPSVLWVTRAGAGPGCGACQKKVEEWYCCIKAGYELILCGSCAHVLLAKMLRFYIRLLDNRVEGIEVPLFTASIKKETVNA